MSTVAIPKILENFCLVKISRYALKDDYGLKVKQESWVE